MSSNFRILPLVLLFSFNIVTGIEPADKSNSFLLQQQPTIPNVPEENNDVQFKQTTGSDDSPVLYADQAPPDLTERSQPAAAIFTYDGQRLTSSPSSSVSEWDAASAAAATPRKQPFSLSSTKFSKNNKPGESLPVQTPPLATASRHFPSTSRKRIGAISEFEEEPEPDKGKLFSSCLHTNKCRSN